VVMALVMAAFSAQLTQWCSEMDQGCNCDHVMMHVLCVGPEGIAFNTIDTLPGTLTMYIHMYGYKQRLTVQNPPPPTHTHTHDRHDTIMPAAPYP
jgi:hypothetical protein